MSRKPGARDWYKDAVFYEIHIKAFMDGNGDGVGDFVGLTERLDYLVELGVDCLWILPMYASPLRDDGYDIADFYAVHPAYGTLADFQKFLKQYGQTVNDIMLRVRLDLLSQKIRDKVIKGKDQVSDAQIQDFYNKNKARFSQPETRDLQIVLTKTQGNANKAKAALIADAARNHLCP